MLITHLCAGRREVGEVCVYVRVCLGEYTCLWVCVGALRTKEGYESYPGKKCVSGHVVLVLLLS